MVNPDDGRFEVFQQWLAASNQLLDISERWKDTSVKLVDRTAAFSENTEYVQLSMFFL
ncbi:MAG: hypothetical protein U7123_03035 [Potamolinea sp.]